MKVWSALLIVFTLPFSGIGQEAYDKYTNYYSVEANVMASFSGLGIQPTFGIYRDRHKIDVGIGIKAYDVWNDGPGILGSYLSYKIFPNQRKNDFSLYFGYHNVFSSHNKGKRFPVIYDEVADKEVRPDKVLLLENMIGIGFEYQMGNRLYMLSDFSVGAALKWNTFQDIENQFEVTSTGMIRIGMGYNVGWKQAR